MRMLLALPLLALLGGAATSPAAPRATDEPVPFPEGYREWTHVKSGLIGPGNPAFPRFAGLHHIYANEAAMRGYRDGTFPAGSVLVFDVIATADDGKGSITEGARRFIDVMVKDPAKYPGLGGWAFEEFTEGRPDARALDDAGRAACATCHARVEKQGHVFSKYRP